MNELFKNIGEWSKESFPDAKPEHHLLKMIEEAHEAIADTNDIIEYSDCLITLFAAINRAGFSYDELVVATDIKLNINKRRTWIEQPDGTHKHYLK